MKDEKVNKMRVVAAKLSRVRRSHVTEGSSDLKKTIIIKSFQSINNSLSLHGVHPSPELIDARAAEMAKAKPADRALPS